MLNSATYQYLFLFVSKNLLIFISDMNKIFPFHDHFYLMTMSVTD